MLNLERFIIAFVSLQKYHISVHEFYWRHEKVKLCLTKHIHERKTDETKVGECEKPIYWNVLLRRTIVMCLFQRNCFFVIVGIAFSRYFCERRITFVGIKGKILVVRKYTCIRLCVVKMRLYVELVQWWRRIKHKMSGLRGIAMDDTRRTLKHFES